MSSDSRNFRFRIVEYKESNDGVEINKKRNYVLVIDERELGWLKRQSNDMWQRLQVNSDMLAKSRYMFIIDILQGSMRGNYLKVRKYERIGNEYKRIMKNYYKRVGE